jgi:hypothetical protein
LEILPQLERKIQLTNWNIMPEEEAEYNRNFNPPRRRDIYYKTFMKIKHKAWKQLKLNYLLKFPEKLPTYLKNSTKRSTESASVMKN